MNKRQREAIRLAHPTLGEAFGTMQLYDTSRGKGFVVAVSLCVGPRERPVNPTPSWLAVARVYHGGGSMTPVLDCAEWSTEERVRAEQMLLAALDGVGVDALHPTADVSMADGGAGLLVASTPLAGHEIAKVPRHVREGMALLNQPLQAGADYPVATDGEVP